MGRPGGSIGASWTLSPPVAAPVLVGYSGGMDSGVLLHLLAGSDTVRARRLRAIHVHHGLHPDADAWAEHCTRTCDALNVTLDVVRVAVVRGSGLGPEGAARAARHAAFERTLEDGEILALAHHRDDQAETFLLRALRGSGVDGLAAMRAWRPHGRGWLWRPLLEHSRDALRAHAGVHGLRWIEDPGNAGTDIDRGYLRNAVLPLLRERWPHTADSFARSAALCGEAAELLDAEDERTLSQARRADGALDVVALAALGPSRRARMLRRWVREAGLPPLPAQGVADIEATLLHAGRDAEACFAWSGACVQRWRDGLHARRLQEALPADWSQAWDGRNPLPLPCGGQLALIDATAFDRPLRAHARRGGERMRLPGRTHSHALKHLLQDADVAPWTRAAMPLLSSDDGELQAAGDVVLAAPLDAWLRARGARLQWTVVA